MGVRTENRERMQADILRSARSQLAETGPAALSLRAVARDLGVASSAVYRYVASRDELLTRLIVEAYDDIGRAAEQAEALVGRTDLLGRWRAACHAVRAWAREHPNEWALVYGSPVPGYRAPEETLAPAARVITLLAGIVRHARPVLDTGATPAAPGGVPPQLQGQVAALGDQLGLNGNDALAVITATSQLVGTISLEVFGHYTGTLDPADAYWEWLVDVLAARVGLTA